MNINKEVFNMIEVAYTREENLIEEMSTEVKDIIRGILEKTS